MPEGEHTLGTGHTGKNGIFAAAVARALKVGAVVFFTAMFITYASQTAMRGLHLVLALSILCIIILIGIAFDMIGTAAAAADAAAFNAMAAKRVSGARQGLWMVKNADRVATFCADIVGDIAGTISGAAAATVAVQVAGQAGFSPVLAGIVAVGAVAAVTVGGKAFGKTLAIRKANNIVHQAGRFVAGSEKVTGITLLRERPRNRARRRMP